MKDDSVYVDHILKCLDWIRRFTSDGHEGGVSLERVWEIVRRDLPALRRAAEAVQGSAGDG